MFLLFGPATDREFAVRYWDGSAESAGALPVPRFTLAIRDAAALRKLVLRPSEMGIAESFVSGEIDVEGDVEAACDIFMLLRPRAFTAANLLRLVSAARRLPTRARAPALRRPGLRGRPHSPSRDRSAISFHYDVGNDFYALWLDREMVYSCAYFATGSEDLETAQQAKLDMICRKLRLAPGERFLDIGCGWGALIRHAARNYGVSATGVTLSAQQADLARARIAAEGLSTVCSVELRDYRDLAASETFDKVASIGMFEHAGSRQLPAYFDKVLSLMKPGGLFLNHGIVMLGVARRRPLADKLADRIFQRNRFARKHVFPDGELVELATAIHEAEMAGFETRHVESLREHYPRTLRHWVARLRGEEETAIQLVGEKVYRTWLLYMSAFPRAFDSGGLSVEQMLFARPFTR
jgi:cyclopropane-fatty-acyl-phospholipid synthase